MSRRILVFGVIALIIIIGMIGIFKLSHPARAIQNPSPTPLMGLAPPEMKLFDMHNAVRKKYALTSFHANETLFSLAEKQAHLMARDGRLFHGTYPSCGYWGQNVGAGPHVWNVFRAFMLSPPHRQNILNPRFYWIGIGVAKNSSGIVFVAVDFCSI